MGGKLSRGIEWNGMGKEIIKLVFFTYTGVRYFMRGVDENGHVANYVETEQIIFHRQYKASFVQVCMLW